MTATGHRFEIVSGTRRVTLALSREDAAQALGGMSLSTFRAHVAPHLRVVYVGRLRLYPVRELERWLAEQECDGGRDPRRLEAR